MADKEKRKTIRRILAGMGGTPYTKSVVDYGIDLAEHHDAELSGITIADLGRLARVGPYPVGAAQHAQDLRDSRLKKARKKIEQEIAYFEEACADAGIDFLSIREEGNPFEQVMNHWRYNDLTILGLQGFFEYGMFSEDDDAIYELIKKGVHPILAVPKSYEPVEKVLIGYNGSQTSAKTMKQYAEFNPWPEATVKVVCFELDELEANQLLNDAQTYLKNHGIEATVDYEDLPARDHLLSYADGWETDLIVLGDSIRSLINREVFGDTALTAIKNSNCPLFLSH